MDDADRRAAMLARDRQSTHTPIGAEEVEGLERMGADIRFRRRQIGLSLVQLAAIADRDASFVSRIERATRRARVDTLRSIAEALQTAGGGQADEMLASWLWMAGDSVAQPSAWPGWAEKLEKRRAKRKRRRQRELDRRTSR